jgi:VIT1/CCC1 family predicted Fe2+/Mn2+ transporter
MAARVRALAEPPSRTGLEAADLRGALGSCLLVVAATFPPTLPFLLVQEVGTALRISNAAAVVALFFAGYSLGKATGVRAWLLGLSMVLLGSALVGLTIALGG